MKKISFFLVALLTTFALGFSSCSDDDPAQTAVPVITAADLSVPAEAGERSLNVEVANPIEGQTLSAVSNESWAHDFVVVAVDQTNFKVSFQVDANTGEVRTAELTLSYPEAQDVKVTLRQMAADESIMIEPSSLNFLAEGGTLPVTVTSAQDWTLEGDVAWCTPSKTEGASGDVVEFVAEANTTDDVLEGTFTFRCGNETATLAVSQNLTGRIIVEQSTYNVEADDESLTISIQTNIAGATVTIPEECNWLRLAPGTTALTKESFNFEIDVNEGEERSVILTFSNTEATEQVKVIQAGAGLPTVENVASEEVMPDANFRAYVLANFDTDSDGILTMEEAAAVTAMEYLDDKKTIFDLTGIEYFSGLEVINIISQKYTTADFTYNINLKRVTIGYSNALETVNVSTCANLEYLSVMGSSYLETLDLTNNTNLTQLNALNTGIATIDLSKNTKLNYLSLTGPNLTSVDLSMLTELETLSVGGDAMTTVDVSKNVNLISLTVSGTNFAKLDVTNNTKLQTLYVNNTALTELDVTNCRDLRTLAFDYTSIAEIDLSNCLKLSSVTAHQDQALHTVWLAEGQTIAYTMGISSDMIKYKETEAPADVTANAVDPNFRAYLLENFDTDGNDALSGEEAAAITEIDITGLGITSIEGVEYFFMPNITVLKLADNQLTSIDLVDFKGIEELYCSNNQIAGDWNFSNNPDLRILEADHNQLTTLSLSSSNSKVVRVIANDNQLTSAKAYFLTSLEEVNLANNQLTSFDCRNNDVIKTVNISNNPGITSWQIWSMPTLENIDISNTGMTEFVTYGDSGYGPALKTLNCSGTQLSTLDVSGNTSLEVLEATNCPNLKSINIGSLNLTTMNVDEGVEIIKDGTTPGGDGLAIDETNFPDETFRNYVSENFDTDNNGELSDSEIAAATVISLVGTDQSNTITVTSLEGVKNFTALKELTLKNVAGLSTINVDDMTTLETMRADAVDGLTTYSVNNCSNLILFRYNPFPFTVQVSEIDISTCPNLVIDPNDSQGFYVSGDVDILWVSAEQKDAVDYWMMWKEIIYYYDIEVKVKENSTPAGDGLAIDATNFPDETFRNYVSENFDTNSDGALSEEEIAAATVISLKGTDQNNTITVTSLEGVKNFTALKELSIEFVTGLTTINMDGCTTLETMNYDKSEGLTSYSVNGCTNLVWFRYYAWPFDSLVTEIDLSTCPNINFDYDKFYIGSSMSGTVWVSADQLSAATKWFNDHEYYDFAQFQFKVKENSTPAEDGLVIDATSFPDETLRNYVSTNFDTNSDGALSEDEIAAATVISFVGTESSPISVTTLEGIENFTALKELTINYVIDLTTINVDNFTTLETMRVDGCRDLTTYTVNNCTNLKLFRYNPYPYDTLVKTLDISTCPNLVIDPDDSQGFYVWSEVETLYISAAQEDAIKNWIWWKESSLTYEVK